MIFDISNVSIYLDADDNNYIYYDDNNDTGSDEDVLDVLTTTEQHLIVVLLIFTFIIGLYANAQMVFMAIVRIRKGVLNWIYILNIAVVHVVVLVTCVPTAVVTVKLATWPFGGFMCKLTNYVMTVCVTIDVVSLVAMVTENYISIKNILLKPFGVGKRRVCVVLVAVWIVSLVAMSPRLTLYQVHQLFVVEETRHICTRNFGPIEKRQADTSLLFIFHYLAPAILISFCAVCTHRKLIKIVVSGAGYSEFFGKDVKEAKGIIQVATIIGLSYLIGWLPVHVTSFLQEFYDYAILSGREIYALCVFLLTFAICPSIVVACKPKKRRVGKCTMQLQIMKEESNTSAPSNESI